MPVDKTHKYYRSSYAAMAEAFAIFDKYDKSETCGRYAAEHDIIYAMSTEDLEMSEEDTQRLKELGWDIDTSLDCWYRYT